MHSKRIARGRVGEPSQSERRATLLVLDGARPDVLESLASAGDLPNISRHVLEPGGLFAATTVFPSTTGVAYLPFLTGCFPGTCNIPGIRWMDRERYRGHWLRDWNHLRSYCGVQAGLLNTDLRPGIHSLFDLVDDVAAVCTPFTRGLPAGRERSKFTRMLLGAQAHYTGMYEVLDRAVGRELERIAPEKHRCVFAVFPGVDGVTHWVDPWHPRVLNVYQQFDQMVGRYAQRGGFSGDHLIAIVSDHGATKIDRHTDVSLAIEAAGLHVLRHPILWRRDPQVAVMISGNAAAHIYLHPGQPRNRRWSLPEMEDGAVHGIPQGFATFLAELDGVALVAGTDGEAVHVVSRDGYARLKVTDTGKVAYAPESGDVLGLGRDVLELSSGDWVAASFDSPYPDGPVQLLQVLRSSRAGDLVVAAAPRCDLRKDWEIPEHRSGHGSLIDEHMRCVVAVNRPVRAPLRTVDIFPLMLRHLGSQVPAGIDGVYPAAAAVPAAPAAH